MSNEQYRFFLKSSEKTLPVKLTVPIEPGCEHQLESYHRASYDTSGKVVKYEKWVNGQVKLEHNYEYYQNGEINRAKIIRPGKATKIITYGPDGKPTWVSEVIDWQAALRNVS